MGTCASNNIVKPNEEEVPVPEIPPHTWRLVDTDQNIRNKFTEDGTLDQKDMDPQHLELRVLLEDPIAQNAIGRYAEKLQVLDLFMCWIDVQEYKQIPAVGFRRSKALHIYHKYIEVGAILSVGGIPDPERFRIKDVIDTARTEPSVLDPHFYDRVQGICFKEMYHNIFIPFKAKQEYQILSNKLKDKYNRVTPDDFEYFSKLGDCNTHGFIVRCRKKSTGKFYAMKIQNKKELLANFKEDMRLVEREKQAFSHFQHPFIINMDYSFQTPSLVFMVTGLATGGDLKQTLEKSAMNRLAEDRVQFYAAECVLALSYMHALGMIYRDLKPQHILLANDGNIKLADVAGIMYEDGVVLSPPTSGLLHIFASTAPTIKTAVRGNAQKAEEMKRMKRTSVMGQLGDMAPEMVISMNEKKKQALAELSMAASFASSKGSSKKVRAPPKSPTAAAEHYSKAVDYWSLGVTLFRLLTGGRPFKDETMTDFVTMCASEKYNTVTLQSEQYASLFSKIEFPWYVSDEAKDLITRLLDVNEKTRLGAGPRGDENVKNHAFFRGIDWTKLEQRHVEAPHITTEDANIPHEQACDFATILAHYDKSHWMDDAPAAEYQQFFSTWEFTSSHTIRVESGLSSTMEQYDKNFKIRRILGEVKEDNIRGPSSPKSGKSGRNGSKSPSARSVMLNIGGGGGGSHKKVKAM